VAAVNTSTKWLRDQAVAGDPLQFKFYDITGAIKTVNGIIQGFHGEALKLDKGQTKVFPLVSQFQSSPLTRKRVSMVNNHEQKHQRLRSTWYAWPLVGAAV
jgi:hypothetical protein